jgi:hypothetical protein
MRILFILIPLLFSHTLYAQNYYGTPPKRAINYESSVGVFGGLYQGRETFGEAGIAIVSIDKTNGFDFSGLGLSAEFNSGNRIIGLKLDYWLNLPILPLSLGLATVSYFQDGHFNQTIRPSAGISYLYFRLSYCYDAVLGERKIFDLNRHQLFLRCYLPIFRYKKANNGSIPSE